MPSATTAGTVREALAAASEALAAAGVGTPRLDAELLLAEALGVGRARFAADPDAPVEAGAARRFGELVRRRLAREPVAYVLGRKAFRRLELTTDRRALVPRPETELLVELALELRAASVLDLGTGSGAVALAIADELPDCLVTATDTSDAALELARENAARLGLESRVRFEAGTLPQGRFEAVLANLPYVGEREWERLEPEITRFEPREALLAGPDGIEVIVATAPAAAVALERGGTLALEVGAGQAGAVAELCVDMGFRQVEARPDLAGIPRVVVATGPP